MRAILEAATTHVQRSVVTIGIIATLIGCSAIPTCPPGQAQPAKLRYEAAKWSQLPGWDKDELKDAWPALLQSCSAIGVRTEWSSACAAARSALIATSGDARTFFETYFEPYAVIEQSGSHRRDAGLITAYYEPLLRGAREASAQFAVPLYAPPPDLLTVELDSMYPELKGKRVRGRLQGHTVVPYFSRAELAADPSLHGNEIVWVADALDAFLLEVQGSGRVQLPTGETIRVRYADENGQPYHSIGRYLVDRGELPLAAADLAGIRQWAAEHPDRLQELLDANPSVVFFRADALTNPEEGPKGALGVPLTPGRSIAVDRAFLPLGAPMFLATLQPGSTTPLEHLVLAQDTGGAIRGPVRADLFWGTGSAAAEQAGRMRESGRLWLLWPKDAPPPAH
ncbi:MAG TPA: MltA domain-containing protein [Steroidobacteraceae bacterium]|nr:MltA domain-containing protein [Steroidobacteraceae bacterium]